MHPRHSIARSLSLVVPSVSQPSLQWVRSDTYSHAAVQTHTYPLQQRAVEQWRLTVPRRGMSLLVLPTLPQCHSGLARHPPALRPTFH